MGRYEFRNDSSLMIMWSRERFESYFKALNDAAPLSAKKRVFKKDSIYDEYIECDEYRYTENEGISE